MDKILFSLTVCRQIVLRCTKCFCCESENLLMTPRVTLPTSVLLFWHYFWIDVYCCPGVEDVMDYDPNLLSDPQWPCGKHKRVLIFASYMVRKHCRWFEIQLFIFEDAHTEQIADSCASPSHHVQSSAGCLTPLMSFVRGQMVLVN